MPHRFRIRIDDPKIRQVYDIAAQAPVGLERDRRGVSFVTSVPPALGRVFAVSTSDTVEVFDGPGFPGQDLKSLEGNVARLAVPQMAPAPAEVLDAADIGEWLAAQRGGTLRICTGDSDYRRAAERLAEWLKATYDIAAELTSDDGRFDVEKSGFQTDFRPSPAQVLIGNAWSNNTLASMDSQWPYNTAQAPATMAGRLTATYAWPGGRRGIVVLTRERELRRDDGTPFGLSYGNTDGFAPRGVNAAQAPHLRQRLLVLASSRSGALAAVEALAATRAPELTLSDYARPGDLALLRAGLASLYRVPWRSNARTASAFQALAGIGVYYKHVPGTWKLAEHVNVMRQLFAAGVRRLRLAPHHAIYITKDWKAPKDAELESLRNELRAAKEAGIRPCVVFVHIPPFGKPGTRELQEWWRQGELMPAGDVASQEFNAYLDKTYEALAFVLNEAKAAGLTAPDSYDLEMGQNLWWGGPAAPRPFPSTGLEALNARTGRIYEFERTLAERLRKAGYAEPTLWWGQTHHRFEKCTDDDVPPECVGRALSFYSAWTGVTTKGWLTGTMYDREPSPNDVWPVRPRLLFTDGAPPPLVLARPESWAADFTRHDNLIAFILKSKTPIAITSLGTVPAEIPGVESSGLSGWDIKRRALTRTLAFWLNQGAAFVLLHSAYEPGAPAGGEMAHSLIPSPIDPAAFRWQDAPPLVTLRAFCDGLADAKPVEKPAELRFRFALSPDPVLIPMSGAGPLRASDAVALLPFQLDQRRFAVAAYVVSPNIADRMEPVRMTLQVDRRLTDGGASLLQPYTGMRGPARILERTRDSTTLAFDLHDDVTWLRFEAE